MTDGCGISCEIALRLMSLDLTDDKSTLLQVMAWCRQATSHYLSQSWPRSMPPYGVTAPPLYIYAFHFQVRSRTCFNTPHQGMVWSCICMLRAAKLPYICCLLIWNSPIFRQCMEKQLLKAAGKMPQIMLQDIVYSGFVLNYLSFLFFLNSIFFFKTR